MKGTIFLLMLLISGAVGGQDYPRKDIDLNRVADDLYSSQDLDMNYEDLYENLVQLLAQPLNLNKATEEDLRFLNVLSELQINSLLNYRKENKRFISIYELQAVPELDLSTITNLAPFIKVDDPATAIDASIWKRVVTESDNYFLLRLGRTIEPSTGYHSVKPASTFAGSADNVYIRLRSSKPGDYSFGLTLEKDAGEAIVWKPGKHYYGADYISFHGQLQNKGKLKNLILGDFQCQFGQGQMLGGVYGMGKGGETITTVRRSNLGLLPFTSVNEAGSLRGIASTVEVVTHFFLTGYYSYNRRDGGLSADTLADPVIGSLQRTGLHRTENELSGRRQIAEKNWGAVLQFKNNAIDAGIMFTEIQFDASFQRDPTPYNQFVFNGTKNRNAGLFLNYTFQNLTFFSELSRSINHGGALTAGILWSLTRKLDLSVLFRKLDRNYYTFFSNAFAENSTAQNETGMYWGWKYRFNRKISMAGYVDLFRFPWLKYRTYAPSNGHEWLLRITLQPSRSVMLNFQVRDELKERNVPEGNPTLFTRDPGEKHNYWAQCDFGLRQNLRLKTRAQFSSFKFNSRTTRGFVLSQDIQADLGSIKVTGRYAVFDTDDYDNRQYVYENDVLLAYSLPAYDGVGVRKMAMVEYKLNRQVSFWFRYAHTRYPYEENIGTGPDKVAGNTKNEVKFQMRITF
jgi:hypothetical protein